MLEGIKPYPRYKNTEVPWLCDVPEHWRVCRIKNLLQEKNFRTLDGAGILLSLTRTKGLIPYTDRTSKAHSAKTLIGYKVFKSNQIVMNRMQAWSGMFGTAKSNGLVSPDYAVYQSLGGNNPDFLTHRLKSPDLVEQYRIASRGIGSGFNRLYNDKFGAIYISVPPCEEQEAIVKFLHYANGKLDRAIRAKRKTIALLNEQKQTIIHRAVTRGLDPTVPLKFSGALGLGDIPVSWNIRPLCAITEIRNERNPNNLPLLSVFLNMGVILYEQGGGQVHAPSLDLSNYQVVKKGDFVLNNQQAWRGSVGVSIHDGIISPAYFVLKLANCHDPVFANYLFRSRAMVDQYVVSSKGVGDIQRTLFWPFLRRILVPIPDIKEQREIVEHLVNETSRLEITVSNITREINLLTEYRTRLISDVVTGKLDVRQAVKNLPAETVDEPVKEIDEVEDEDLEEAA